MIKYIKLSLLQQQVTLYCTSTTTTETKFNHLQVEYLPNTMDQDTLEKSLHLSQIKLKALWVYHHSIQHQQW